MTFLTTETENIYILKMGILSGTAAGSLPRQNWTVMSADMAWVIPALVLPKTA